ncbi:5417_t:CDS:2, partial [Gigaspora margarita]
LPESSNSEETDNEEKWKTDDDKEYEKEHLINKTYLYQEIYNESNNFLNKYCLENQTNNTKEIENKNFNLGNMNKEQKHLIKNLLLRYKDVFAWNSLELDKTTVVQHEIFTKNKPQNKSILDSTKKQDVDTINLKSADAHYIMILQDYNFVVKYRPGKQLSHVDSSSVQAIFKINSNEYKQLVEYLIHSRVSKNLTKEQIRQFKIRASSYLVKENILYQKLYYELTRPLRPLMKNDIKSFIKGCDICQRRGKPRAHEPLNPVIVGQPFVHISMTLTKQGNKYLIVATEYLT